MCVEIFTLYFPVFFTLSWKSWNVLIIEKCRFLSEVPIKYKRIFVLFTEIPNSNKTRKFVEYVQLF